MEKKAKESDLSAEALEAFLVTFLKVTLSFPYSPLLCFDLLCFFPMLFILYYIILSAYSLSLLLSYVHIIIK